MTTLTVECPAPSRPMDPHAVPEPGTLSILAVLVVALVMRRIR